MFKVYMQHSDHLKSVACFDDDLLYNQLFDVVNLIDALCMHAPDSTLLAVRQWRGYEGYLLLYLRRMQIEVQKRDLGSWLDDDRNSPYAVAWLKLGKAGNNLAPKPPRWVGGHWFLESNRSELIRINPEHYAHQFPAARMEMPYLFPQNVPGRFDYTLEVSKKDRDLLDDMERVIPEEYIDFVAMKGLAW
jgi:hypothetical protein